MKQFLYAFILSAVALTLLSGTLLQVAPHAQAALVTCGNENNGDASSGCKLGDLFNTAARLVNYLFSGAAVVATGGVVYGGFLMVTSAGNPSGQAAGKKAVTNSLIGLAVILVSYVLVQTMFIVVGYSQGGNILKDPGSFVDPNNNSNDLIRPQ
ncbi:MAG: hypothetical protein JNK33_00780 [Candidatus Doudnabacteria bacterium]|nr:hypothetical protein [Candidatus Doudnabacteria bacterium]